MERFSLRGVAGFVAAEPRLAGPLRALAKLGLPDAWIGAGFLRNAIWDALCGLPFGTNPPGDVDVAWFDVGRSDPATDAAVEQALAATWPGLPWSVRNQVRMAARNGDAPYADTLDAIAHWPETATAVAARWTPAGVEVAAPWGVEDLLGLVLQPTPAFSGSEEKRAVFAARAAAKGWVRRWHPHVTQQD